MQRTVTRFLVGLAGMTLAAMGFSQSALHCLKNGSLLPVYEIRGKTPYCFVGDGLARGETNQLTMLPAEEFGSGYLEVEILSNERRGVVKSGAGYHFVSDKGWFHFSARVTAREDIRNCYFALRLEALDEASFLCQPIGDLKAGESRTFTIYTQLRYELPKQLHFYSGMEEIRSNLIPTRYRYEYGTFLLASH